MAELHLFWHRNDLRISDNGGLAATIARSPQTVGVFCLDPAILEGDDVAPARVAYLVGCLAALREDYRRLGGEFLLLRGDPRRVIPAVAEALGAIAVAWNWDVEPYSRARDRAVLERLTALGIGGAGHWDRLLHEPGAVMTGKGDPYTVYGPFRKNWDSRPKAIPAPMPTALQPLTAAQRTAIAAIEGVTVLEKIPTARELGYPWANGLILEAGTAAARDRLDQFCDRAIEAYGEARNFPAQPGTSGLSAALKFGAIGIREIWQRSQEARDRARSDDAIASITTWQQELTWREFYQHVLYFFPELADGPYREPLKNFPWENNETHFEAWCEGQTGFPIVDAAMRQLNETGWMHNRCRMIVASFLTKNLIIDWRWGERYFMQNLIDGDLAANNGGWQWSASSGMDPKPLRIFNPARQAQQFDPDGDYIRQWLPEARSLDTGTLLTGELAPFEQRSTGYPAPIVDRKAQQERFKRLYQAQKGQ